MGDWPSPRFWTSLIPLGIVWVEVSCFSFNLAKMWKGLFNFHWCWSKWRAFLLWCFLPALLPWCKLVFSSVNVQGIRHRISSKINSGEPQRQILKSWRFSASLNFLKKWSSCSCSSQYKIYKKKKIISVIIFYLIF